jgi:hypothetical protein
MVAYDGTCAYVYLHAWRGLAGGRPMLAPPAALRDLCHVWLRLVLGICIGWLRILWFYSDGSVADLVSE